LFKLVCKSNYQISIIDSFLFVFVFRELDKEAGEFDIAEYYRLHIAVERIRYCERVVSYF